MAGVTSRPSHSISGYCKLCDAADGFVEDVTALYKKGQFVAARVLSLHEDDNDCCISLRVGVSVSDDV